MSALFSSIRLRDLALPNRIMVAPMCQYSAEGGKANDWHFTHINNLALSGAAMFCLEATHVEAIGRITPGCLGLWNDATESALRPVLASVRRHSTIAIAIQLAHAGRKASTSAPWKGGHPLSIAEVGWTPIYAPSALPFAPGYQVPAAMTLDQIGAAVEAFAAAALRALNAGARLVEIHAAHGYLLHSFLSPLSNQRTDEFGGSFENRIRMLRQVVNAVRKVWPDAYPISVRISCTDWVDGGWTVDDAVALASVLKGLGVDVMDCSSAGVVPGVRIPVGPGYQAGFAEKIRREADMPAIAVGMITEPAQADHIIRTGQADAVMLARQFLRQPYWPLYAAQVLGYDLKWPSQYDRARGK